MQAGSNPAVFMQDSEGYVLKFRRLDTAVVVGIGLEYSSGYPEET